MATKTITLNSTYKRAMHRPMTIDGFTLYTKADGYAGQAEGESLAEKSDNYIKQCNRNYNSPTNIRKVFITGKGIAVQYYAVPISSNNSARHWKFTEFDEGINMFDIALKMMNYSADFSQYNMSKAAGMKCEEPVKYKVTGNGIGIFSNPWVCSNIEEIYFDWTMFIPNDVAPYFQDICNEAYYRAFMTKSENNSEQAYSQLQNFFEAFNMGGTKDIRKRFPRLRFIAMISRLQDILDRDEIINKVDLQFNNFEESTHTWYEANRELIASSGSMVLYHDLKAGLQFPNKEFTVKANQYKFDYDKLDGIVKAYLVKITDAERAKYGSATKIEDTQEQDIEDLDGIELCELEKQCIEIEKQYGEATLKNALLFVAKGSDIPLSQIKKMLEEFSKPNRVRLAKAIGFKDMQ